MGAWIWRRCTGCPTPEKVDLYNLQKDLKEFTRRIRLMEHFYSDEKMEGDFSDMPAFKKKSNWCPARNREVAIEKYVEALEKKILSHGFNEP